jgi:hypothetical protein
MCPFPTPPSPRTSLCMANGVGGGGGEGFMEKILRRSKQNIFWLSHPKIRSPPAPIYLYKKKIKNLYMVSSSNYVQK